MPALVHVALAVIVNQHNEVLISLRDKDVHQGGLWEFPGGKLESGESVFDALKREIKEELNITIHKAVPLKKIQHKYSDITVLLDTWRVDLFEGEPVGSEGQKIKWLAVSELNESEFPEANRCIVMTLKLSQKYMITGAFNDPGDFASKLESSLKNGISLIQLRCKNISVDDYKKLAEISMVLCHQYNAVLLLNTSLGLFLDISNHAECPVGLHLNSQMLHAIESRPVNSEFLLSVSCHTDEEIEKAKQLDADIVLLSPVKETKSHPGVNGIGWKKFKDIAANINVPVYALGGMSEADLDDALSSGAKGVAAISSFWG